MSTIDALKWRYATKKMNGERVSQEKVDQILMLHFLPQHARVYSPLKSL